MIQCQICGNLDGPFESAMFRYQGMEGCTSMKLICEDCANKLKKERVEKNETANICNKRYVD